MSILQYFDEYKLSDVEITDRIEDSVGGKDTVAYPVLATIKAIFYEGSSAESLVSERFRSEVVGVFVVEPAEAIDGVGDPIQIKDNAKATIISDGRVFRIIHADNIMDIDEVLLIPVKEFK